MRNTSQLWKNIAKTGNFHMETVARVYGAAGNDPNGTSGSDSRGSYKQYATITAPVIKHGLLPDKTLSVGNCISASLSFTLMTTDIVPKSAIVVILSRLKYTKNGTTDRTEWLEFGTFRVDHRQINDNLIDLECYDYMKMGNQKYIDSSASVSWPKTVSEVVTNIASQIGVNIDSRTVSGIINSSFGAMDFVTKPDDETTLLRILSDIGSIIGGNWCITPNNTLRFVPLASSPEPRTGGYILDHAGNKLLSDSNDNIIWDNESVVTRDDTVDVPVVIGSMTTANQNTISRVTMTKGSDTRYSFGDDSGYELLITDNNYATESLCAALYERLVGTTYSPFELTNAVYDPATELGDFVYAGDTVNSVVYTETVKLDTGFSADMAAPGEDELENEYPFQTMEQRVQYVASESKQNRTMIEQTQESITLMAESVDEFEYNTQLSINSMGASITSIQNDKANKSTLRSEFAIDPTNITLTAGEDEQGHATGTITFNAGALIVNSTNFQLDADGIMTCNGANINGVFQTAGEMDDPAEIGAKINFKTVIENGVVEFFKENSQIGVIGIDPINLGYYISPGSNANQIELSAFSYSGAGAATEITGGSGIRVNKNGDVRILGRILYGAYNELTPFSGVDGSFTIDDGAGTVKTITVRAGIITSIT